jgi:hypothetical protein
MDGQKLDPEESLTDDLLEESRRDSGARWCLIPESSQHARQGTQISPLAVGADQGLEPEYQDDEEVADPDA